MTPAGTDFRKVETMSQTSGFKRRDFMKLSAKAAAGASLLSTSALARNLDEYGGFSGNKNFKFIKAPATVFEFDLTPG